MKIFFAFAAMIALAGCASTGEQAFYAQQTKAAEARTMIDAAKVESQTARYKAIEAVAARADASTLAVLASGLNSEGAVLAAMSGNNSQTSQTFVQAPESNFDKALRTLAVVGGLARDVVVPVRLAQYARDTLIRQSDNAVNAEAVRTNGYVAINGQTAGLGAAIANKPAAQPTVTNITHNCQGGRTGNGGNGSLGGNGSPGGNSGNAQGGATTTQPYNTGAGGVGGPGGLGGAGGYSGSANGGNC